MQGYMCIFAAMTLGRGRVARPTLRRNYPSKVTVLILHVARGPQSQSGHEGGKKNLLQLGSNPAVQSVAKRHLASNSSNSNNSSLLVLIKKIINYIWTLIGRDSWCCNFSSRVAYPFSLMLIYNKLYIATTVFDTR